ncbi:MAG: M23 family metallopeptidase [Lachnospiraceae bacterium]|nr:M23 family metallopeptidase [Lachnospiraceae bacterium]
MKKKTKKKKRYTFMLVTSGTGDAVRQIQMPSWTVKTIIGVIVMVLVICSYGIANVIGGVTVFNGTSKEVEELTNQNLELTQQKEELTNKVAILSDTVNQKVEEETAKAAETAERCKPTGFPLSGTAGMTEANANEAAGAGATYIPMVIFDAAAGTNVITAGDGTVAYVGPDDTDYGNMIKIDHGNGYVSVYRNAAAARVSEGDEIPRGTVIFQMDETSTRLGYEIISNDEFIDPLSLLEIAG